MKLILIGYMGSGKSTVGKRLANRLDFSFIDLDKSIEEYANASVEDIFDNSGEELFRQVENHVLDKVLDQEKVVIATGGGTPCHSNNMAKLKQSGFVVYLYLSPEKIKKRLEKAKKSRPLVKGFKKEGLLLFVQNHLDERSVYYEQADFKIDADRINAGVLDEIKEMVLERIQERQNQSM